MTYQAILIASVVLLLAFGVERLGKAWGLPSVVILLGVGLLGKPVLAQLGWTLNGLDAAVGVLGVIGLVLIVLEGAFDIELRRDKLRHAAGALGMGTAGVLVCTGLFAVLGMSLLALSPMQAVLAAMPFAVISSAVAIPSSAFLPPAGREFVLYESAWSDILGILLFFTLLHSDGTFGGALLDLVRWSVLSLVLAAACSLALIWLLLRLDGHVRFMPLLAGVFALYAGGKLLHLSPLLMVLFFGLLVNNTHYLEKSRWFKHLHETPYLTTLSEFKRLARELTFAVRGFFFILLGYWTDLHTLLAPEAWVAAATVLLAIYGSRSVLLRLGRIEHALPLTWVAPRGLITVLLYLEARQAMALPAYLDGAVLLVVFASALLVVQGRRCMPVLPDAEVVLNR